jgi:RNA polymerase sigma-70 factor (ECF subfamily)
MIAKNQIRSPGESPLDYSQCSDETLVQLIGRRDPEALSEFYDRHAQTVYNMIVRLVPNLAAAEELLQETFWQVWQQAGQSSSSGSATAWLYRLARTKSLDQLREQRGIPKKIENRN